jgi:hypothetical protein
MSITLVSQRSLRLEGSPSAHRQHAEGSATTTSLCPASMFGKPDSCGGCASRSTASPHGCAKPQAPTPTRLHWWIEDELFYALALDPEKRQVRAVTSNVGHYLACGIIFGTVDGPRQRVTGDGPGVVLSFGSHF